MRSPSPLAFGLGGVVLATTLAATAVPAHAQITRFVPCTGSNGGTSGLVQAILDARSAGSGLIQLETGCTYTFTSSFAASNNALPVITGRIAITGKNAVIARSANAASEFRIAQVAQNGFLSLTGVTIRGGSAANGGGIFNQGSLSLKFTTLTGNSAINGAGGGFAATGGSLTLLYRTTISDNLATSGGGGSTNGGTLRAIATLFTGNTAVNGGALHLAGASRLVGSVVAHNRALGLGGGIFNGGTLEIRDSKITRNITGIGGGLYVDQGRAELLRSHVTGNVARTTGGGIFNRATVELQKSKVTRNVPNNCAGPSAVPGCGTGTTAAATNVERPGGTAAGKASAQEAKRQRPAARHAAQARTAAASGR
jgi:hypothetical protein